MIEQKNDIIKKYIYNDYIIYIKDDINCLSAYLQKYSYGIIDLMFGIDKKDITIDSFIQLVENNLQDYIDLYITRHEI